MRGTRFLGIALIAAFSLAAAPAVADPDKDESGHGRHGKQKHSKGKQEFWDGHCKVERKWKGGEYKEERKCAAPYGAPYAVSDAPPPVVEPSVVITLPPIVIAPGQSK